MTVLAYLADALILGCYWACAMDPRHARPFHWANAVGAVPLLYVEVSGGVWPAAVITAAFGAIGWVGALRG